MAPRARRRAGRSAGRASDGGSGSGEPGLGGAEEEVVGLGLADRDPDAVAVRTGGRSRRPRRTPPRTPRCRRRAPARRSCPGRRAPSQPWSMSASRTRARSATSGSTRSSSSASASSEATAAACAIDETPNGSAHLRIASATGSGPSAKPTRRPASPYALEKVRRTTTLLAAAGDLAARRGVSGSRDELAGMPRRRRRARVVALRRGTRSSSSRWTDGPVGLFGEQTTTTFVRSVIAASIAGRSCRASGSAGPGRPWRR